MFKTTKAHEPEIIVEKYREVRCMCPKVRFVKTFLHQDIEKMSTLALLSLLGGF